MDKKKLEQLQFIFDGIESGRLEHDQAVYSCGSAKCVAGWAVHLYVEDPDLIDWINAEVDDLDIGTWFEDYFDLYPLEADLIVDCGSTASLHRLTMKALSQGRRLTPTNCVMDCHSEAYNKSAILSIYDHQNLLSVVEFLGLDPEDIDAKDGSFCINVPAISELNI